MAEPSPTAISSSPCHLGGLTRLAFAPDGQYVPLHLMEVIIAKTSERYSPEDPIAWFECIKRTNRIRNLVSMIITRMQ